MRRKRDADPENSITAHLEQDARQNDRSGGGCLGMGVGNQVCKGTTGSFTRKATMNSQKTSEAAGIVAALRAMSRCCRSGPALKREQHAEQHDGPGAERVDQVLRRRVSTVGRAQPPIRKYIGISTDSHAT